MIFRALGGVGAAVATAVLLVLVYAGGATTGSAGGNARALERQPAGAVPATSVRLTAAGDHGGSNSRGGQTLNLVAALAPVAHLALGDFSYSDLVPESAWCDWVVNGDPSAGVSGVGSIPVQLVGGNHEEDSRADGFIRDFAACLPDRVGAVGDYGVEYYMDIGGLVRVIMIAADVTIDGEYYDYGSGPHRAWLEQAVTGARLAGIPWVVVGMHKVCVTMGTKSCEVGESVMDWLLAPGRADLVLQGHDHGVQRSHQLTCVDVGTSTPGCVADTDGAHDQGDGGLVLVGGSFGRDAYTHDPNDSERGYFAKWMAHDGSPPGAQQGVWQLDFTATTLTGRWVGSTSSYTDGFSITAGSGATPAPAPSGESSPAPPPADEVDTVPPNVGVGLARSKLTRRGRAVLRVSCPAAEQSSPCTGLVRLKSHKPRALASGERRRLSMGRKRFVVAAGESRRVVVRVPRRHLALLAGDRALRVRAIVRAEDAAGNRLRFRTLVTLRGYAPSR